MVRVFFVALVAALGAGDAPAASAEFARHFSSKCTTVLYLHDVLPHIERVLSSEKLKAALKDSLPSAGPGALNLDNAAAMVSAQQQLIPRSVAIGITADAADQLQAYPVNVSTGEDRLVVKARLGQRRRHRADRP